MMSLGFGEGRCPLLNNDKLQHLLLFSVKPIVVSFLRLKRQSIYILSQRAQAGGMECSTEQFADTSVQCCDCADTRSYENSSGGKLV